jgi:hypothetical protein
MCYPPHRENEYRAAIALNNVGVALLRRRLYREAVVTFKDAMILLPTTMADRAANESPLNAVHELNTVLHRAYQRISLVPNSPQPDDFQIVVVSSQQDPAELYDELADESAVQFCINIDPLTDDDWDDDRYDIDACTMIFNSGVTHVCYAMAMTNARAAFEALKGGMALFRTGESLLSEFGLMIGSTDEKVDSTITIDSCLLLVSTLLIRSVTQILFQLESPTTDTYYTHFTEILSMLGSQQLVSDLSRTQGAAAA